MVVDVVCALLVAGDHAEHALDALFLVWVEHWVCGWARGCGDDDCCDEVSVLCAGDEEHCEECWEEECCAAHVWLEDDESDWYCGDCCGGDEAAECAVGSSVAEVFSHDQYVCDLSDFCWLEVERSHVDPASHALARCDEPCWDEWEEEYDEHDDEQCHGRPGDEADVAVVWNCDDDCCGDAYDEEEELFDREC